MILADALSCQIATPNAVKIELINCTTSLFDAAIGVELFWIGLGALATAVAAIFALLAWLTAQAQLRHSERVHKDQLEAKRIDEVRKATASLVSAFHSLLVRSGVSRGAFAAVRQDVYEDAMLFQMKSHPELDFRRFEELIFKLLRTADLRNEQVKLKEGPAARSSIAYSMVKGYVACLLEYGRKSGDIPLLKMLDDTVEFISVDPRFVDDPEIQYALFPRIAT